MTSQQAAALLHAAGVTSPDQWLHFHECDGGDAGYTNAVVLLEAAGLRGDCQIRELANGESYYAMRFSTENGAIELTSPEGLPDRSVEPQRMVGTPAECLACQHVEPVVELTPLGRSTLAGLRGALHNHDGNTTDEAMG